MRVVGVAMVLALLGLVIVGATLKPTRHRTDAGPLLAAAPTPSSPASNPVVAFFGDGTMSDLAGSPAWPAVLSTKRGWRPSVDAVAGSGFVGGQVTQQSLVNRLNGLLRERPAGVIVQGGHDDLKVAPAIIEAAAITVLQQLQAGLPGTSVALVGPVDAAPTPSPVLLEVDAALARAARRVGVPYLSAVRGGWFRGHPLELGSSGDRLTVTGHSRLGARVDERLPETFAREGVVAERPTGSPTPG